jgi:hypothetical protein
MEPGPVRNILSNAAIIVTTAATGIVVATILRKRDNLVKLVGSSASIVTIAATQCFLFVDLRAKTLTPETIVGIGVIAISTWTYHYYKEQQPLSRYSVLGSGSSSESDFALTFSSSETDSQYDEIDQPQPKEPRHTPTPTPLRILTAIIVVAVLAALTGFQSVWSLPANNNDVHNSFNVPVPDDNVDFGKPHVPLLTAKPSGVDDIKRFFIPNGITPAVWGQTNTSYNCISNWIEREKVYPVSTKFTEWEHEFIKSGCPVYPIPKGGLLFHQYWSGKWRPFNQLSIEAWLATQRLADGHRLIYWYDNGELPKYILRRFQPYANHVEFRKFDSVKEAKGTCVAHMPEYNSEEYRKANNMQVATLSDITRNLLLSKYGGVWLDSDTLPMRDLTPLIRSGPSAAGVGDSELNEVVTWH